MYRPYTCTTLRGVYIPSEDTGIRELGDYDDVINDINPVKICGI